jgi:vrille protein
MFSSSSSSCSSQDIPQEEYKSSRKKRAFIPDNKKTPIYWSQRSRNTLSAKRSRVKRRMNDLVLETKLTQLTNDNGILRAKIDILTRKFDQLKHDALKSSEKPTVLNILDQSSAQIHYSDNDPPVTSTEHLSLEKSSMLIKCRFQLLNIASDS